MERDVLIYSGKDLTKFVVASIISTILFGLYGLIFTVFLQWLSRHSYSLAEREKHGIAHDASSRLGGLAIFLSNLILMLIAWLASQYDEQLISFESNLVLIFGVLGCFMLGLIEDLKNNVLRPIVRLAFELIIFGVILIYLPFLVPKTFGFAPLDIIFGVPILGWLATLIFCVGFLNSVNMGDGANGLIPGIMSIAFGIFYLETNDYLYAIMLTSCSIFAIFNILSGRIFIGDAGSYGLGALIGIVGLNFFAKGIFSAPFLACLLMYPCVEFLFTLIRRYASGVSLLNPDMKHLHCLLFPFFKKYLRSKTFANSLTGLTITGFSSGLTLLGYFLNWWPITSNAWVWLFLIQCSIYGVLLYLLGLRPFASRIITSNI